MVSASPDMINWIGLPAAKASRLEETRL
ncbi:TPA: hypothetical protein N0F65_010314 [Lagenidium giganteum]|uniref:Uncharacterized protein n=1 Tax=Lagenidium giganteum TaxID=4803 RepID=A0AAV2Z2S1_9STRA|nr:TPA: hypothetical protein N0F65_010314 [Lagenidium giganteum]